MALYATAKYIRRFAQIHRVTILSGHKTSKRRLEQKLVLMLSILQNAPSWIDILKPHLLGLIFCNAIRRFFMRENLSRRVVIHTRRDSLSASRLGRIGAV